MKKNIIEVKNLVKKIKEKEILKNISFNIEEGTINGLLGPNGSGKTTIIRLLNGVITPTAGEIAVFGNNPEKSGDEVRRKSGVVTETTNLYHEMSAWDNLMFFSDIYGLDEKDRARELLTEFGMWEHRAEPLGTYSTGMKKRVALSKALLHRPKLLFLDEPTNGLDPEGIKMVLEYLKVINQKENITVIICSHVLQQLENVCDSYIFIKNGELIESGKREDIEKRHMKEIKFAVETGLRFEGDSFAGFACERLSADKVEFTLERKEQATELLRAVLGQSWVHECHVTNNGLDSLYFLLGGGQA